MDLDQIYVKYKIIGTIYLSDFFKDHGKNLIFKQLQALCRDQYDPDDRIAVIYDCPDQYSYNDLPGDALTTLQKYLTQLNITNCFVLAVSSMPTVADECAQVRKLYSTDTWPIQHQIVNGLPISTRPSIKQDTFCVLPWMHLYVGTDGNVLPCCSADHQYPMGNIEEQSIDNIAKSATFNQLRANMIAGIRSKECARCYQQEDSGLPSPRRSYNKLWPDILVEDHNPLGTIDKFEPVYLDIRLNNICNLKCRMCSGYFSSAIAQEETELFGSTNSVKLALRNSQRKSSLTEILKYLPLAEKIYFAGGEPLLAAEHYKILKTLIKCGNTNLEISYNTNFTTLQYQDISVLDLWKKFKNITIGASLDAIGDVAEYVRSGTNWKTIESNLELVKTNCPHVNFTVTSTVGLLNVSSLIDLQKTWHTNGILNLSKFSLNTMISPGHLIVSTFPLEHKTRLDKLIKNHIVWCQNNGADRLATTWNNVLHYMWSNDTSHQLAEFKRLTNLMDVHRKQSLAQVLPELQNLL
jgi:radical SAM protein with 4Fe4S-binding SPASM domain